MVCNHSRSHTHHIRARCTAFLVRQGATTEPIVQRRFAALELGEIMVGTELLRSCKGDPSHCSHGALVRNRRRRRGFAAGGRSSIAVKRLKSSAGKEK